MSESPYIKIISAENFEAQVIQQSFQTPVLVDFWAEWCAPCRTLMPMLSSLAESYQGQFILAKVNSDEQQALASQFGVRSLPTVKLFKDGVEVDEFMGALPEAQVRDFLDKHLPQIDDPVISQAIEVEESGDPDHAIELLQSSLKNAPQDMNILKMLLELLVNHKRINEAAELLKTVPLAEQQDERILAITNHLLFATVAEETSEDETFLQDKISLNPQDNDSRYQLAALLVLKSDYEPALEQLLTIMRNDRAFREDAGRKGMLAIFSILGNEGEIVKHYRRQMSALLY